MKVLIDLNVMLDFLQKRQPFFEEAARVMDAVLYARAGGVLPAHAITTLYYFLAKGAEKHRVRETLQWLLRTFDIAPSDKETLTQALALGMNDFEDAVTCVSAVRAGCSYILTRNTADFAASSVPPLAPGQFLELLDKQ